MKKGMKGENCGGIWSLNDLRDRCYVDDVTGCWHWRLSKTKDGKPKVHLPVIGKPRTNMLGRRAALFLSTGVMLPNSSRVWAAPMCHSNDCCNPAHCVSGTAKQWGVWARESGILKTPAKRAAAALQARRNRVLTDAQAAEIFASEGTGKEIAARFGVSRQIVCDVRLGKRYRAVCNSVFGQRVP